MQCHNSIDLVQKLLVLLCSMQELLNTRGFSKNNQQIISIPVAYNWAKLEGSFQLAYVTTFTRYRFHLFKQSTSHSLTHSLVSVIDFFYDKSTNAFFFSIQHFAHSYVLFNADMIKSSQNILLLINNIFLVASFHGQK